MPLVYIVHVCGSMARWQDAVSANALLERPVGPPKVSDMVAANYHSDIFNYHEELLLPRWHQPYLTSHNPTRCALVNRELAVGARGLGCVCGIRRTSGTYTATHVGTRITVGNKLNIL